MDKIIKDGKVAVAITREFGSGWSTWTDVSPMDPEFNQLFIDEKWEEAEELAKKKDLYIGGIRNIVIVWVDEGTEFIIDENDGLENLITKEETKWLIA